MSKGDFWRWFFFEMDSEILFELIKGLKINVKGFRVNSTNSLKCIKENKMNSNLLLKSLTENKTLVKIQGFLEKKNFSTFEAETENCSKDELIVKVQNGQELFPLAVKLIYDKKLGLAQEIFEELKNEIKENIDNAKVGVGEDESKVEKMFTEEEFHNLNSDYSGLKKKIKVLKEQHSIEKEDILKKKNEDINKRKKRIKELESEIKKLQLDKDEIESENNKINILLGKNQTEIDNLKNNNELLNEENRALNSRISEILENLSATEEIAMNEEQGDFKITVTECITKEIYVVGKPSNKKILNKEGVSFKILGKEEYGDFEFKVDDTIWVLNDRLTTKDTHTLSRNDSYKNASCRINIDNFETLKEKIKNY